MTQLVLSSEALQAARGLIEADAQFSEPLRVAPGQFLIDMPDDMVRVLAGLAFQSESASEVIIRFVATQGLRRYQ